MAESKERMNSVGGYSQDESSRRKGSHCMETRDIPSPCLTDNVSSVTPSIALSL